MRILTFGFFFCYLRVNDPDKYFERLKKFQLLFQIANSQFFFQYPEFMLGIFQTISGTGPQYLSGSFSTVDSFVNTWLCSSFNSYWSAMSFLIGRYPNLANNAGLSGYHQNLSQYFDSGKTNFNLYGVQATANSSAIWSALTTTALTTASIAKQSISKNYTTCTNYYQMQYYFLLSSMQSALSSCSSCEASNVTPLYSTIFSQLNTVNSFMSTLTGAVWGCYSQSTESDATTCVTNNVISKSYSTVLQYFITLQSTYSLVELNACFNSINMIFQASLSSLGTKLSECLDVRML